MPWLLFSSLRPIFVTLSLSLQEAQAELEVAMKGLRAKQASLKEVQDKLQNLKDKLEFNKNKKVELENQVSLKSYLLLGCN